MMTILLVICIGDVVVASLLIHGARKVGLRSICANFSYICFQGRPHLLMPWIILTVISLILSCGQAMRHLVNAEHAYWVSYLFVIAIGDYFFIVVWSFRYFDQN